MNCEGCLIQHPNTSDIYSFLCEQCRADDPCVYLLEVAYDHGTYAPFSFANGTEELADAMSAFRARNLLFRLLAHRNGAYRHVETSAAA